MLPPPKTGFNTEVIKYAIVILGTPYWWPFVKTLWKELNDSLREEGGILGRTLVKGELERKNIELGEFESPLVSELREAKGAPRRTSPVSARGPDDTGAARAPSTERGFRGSAPQPPRLRGFR